MPWTESVARVLSLLSQPYLLSFCLEALKAKCGFAYLAAHGEADSPCSLVREGGGRVIRPKSPPSLKSVQTFITHKAAGTLTEDNLSSIHIPLSGHPNSCRDWKDSRLRNMPLVGLLEEFSALCREGLHEGVDLFAHEHLSSLQGRSRTLRVVHRPSTVCTPVQRHFWSKPSLSSRLCVPTAWGETASISKYL